MFDSEILEIIRGLDAAIGAFEKRQGRLLADERRLLTMLRTVRQELAAKVGRS
jgi:hypothetical protein